MNKQKLLFIGGDNTKWYSHFDTESLAVYYNILLTYSPVIALLGICSNRTENLCPHKNMYLNVLSTQFCHEPKTAIKKKSSLYIFKTRERKRRKRKKSSVQE